MAHRTDWFKDAKWGIFMHYLPSSEEKMDRDKWNKTIDEFDVTGLAKQLIDLKAGYFFLSIGQNSGFYLSPNGTYDKLVKREKSFCSNRDIIAELAEALKPGGIPLMVYLPSHAPAFDIQATENLSCTPFWDASEWQLKPGTYRANPQNDDKLTTFQINWEAVIKEWSERWGKDVKGWWFDGCYYKDKMYYDTAEPNFCSFASAARAGNPDSIVAFNSGIKVPAESISEYEDYTAGEVATRLPVASDIQWAAPVKRFVNGAQYHILTYLGGFWGRDDMRFSDEMVIGYTEHINSQDGVITWDVGLNNNGNIAQNSFKQLMALSKKINPVWCIYS